MASEKAQPHLFLVDEILNGTNTVERMAGAAAILERLSRRHAVMVTTHDVELSALLPPVFRALHFRENADPDALFDYRLREGHVTTRNAIALLATIGFPADVVAAAGKIASMLDRERT